MGGFLVVEILTGEPAEFEGVGSQDVGHGHQPVPDRRGDVMRDIKALGRIAENGIAYISGFCRAVDERSHRVYLTGIGEVTGQDDGILLDEAQVGEAFQHRGKRLGRHRNPFRLAVARMVRQHDCRQSDGRYAQRQQCRHDRRIADRPRGNLR